MRPAGRVRRGCDGGCSSGCCIALWWVTHLQDVEPNDGEEEPADPAPRPIAVVSQLVEARRRRAVHTWLHGHSAPLHDVASVREPPETVEMCRVHAGVQVAQHVCQRVGILRRVQVVGADALHHHPRHDAQRAKGDESRVEEVCDGRQARELTCAHRKGIGSGGVEETHLGRVPWRRQGRHRCPSPAAVLQWPSPCSPL